jgi:hypothetical protein
MVHSAHEEKTSRATPPFDRKGPSRTTIGLTVTNPSQPGGETRPHGVFYAKATTAVDGDFISRGAYLTRGRGRGTQLRQLVDPASGSARNRGVSLTGSASRLVIQRFLSVLVVGWRETACCKSLKEKYALSDAMSEYQKRCAARPGKDRPCFFAWQSAS